MLLLCANCLATCQAVLDASQVALEIASYNIVCIHRVLQHFCCCKYCMKLNQPLLFTTIVAMLQWVFEMLYCVTSFVQHVLEW